MIKIGEKNKLKQTSISKLDNIFINYCRDGRLEHVKYILTSLELPKHARINCQYGNALSAACRYGHLEIVQYLTSSPELKQHIAYDENNFDGLVWANSRGHTEIVKYLISNINKNIENANLASVEKLKKQYEELFISVNIACHQNALHELYRYYIVDLEIEKTDKIKAFIADKPDLEKMFAARELKNELDKQLAKSKDIKSQSQKI